MVLYTKIESVNHSFVAVWIAILQWWGLTWFCPSVGENTRKNKIKQSKDNKFLHCSAKKLTPMVYHPLLIKE